MKRIMLSLLAAACGLAAMAAPAVADSRYDVEHARANARAGGPVSEYDYELLERWGHLKEAYPQRYERRRAHKHRRTYVEGRRWRY